MTQLLRTHGEAVLPALVLMALVVLVQGVRLRAAVRRSGLRGSLVRLGAEAVAVGNLVGALAITLSPRYSFGRSLNLVPFSEVYSVWVAGGFYSAPRDEVLINLGLIAPFAFAAGFAWNRVRSGWVTVLAVAAIAAGIETVQFVLPLGRVCSVTDVLLPVLGALPAAWLAVLLRSLRLDRARQAQTPLGALVEGRVAQAHDAGGGR